MPDGGASPPNPHALDPATGVADRHCGGTVMLSTAGGARWPLRIGRVWPGVRALVAPRQGLYDVSGGPHAVAAPSDLAALLDSARWPADWPRLVAARAVAAEGPAWDALLAMAQERRLDLHPLVRWERALLDRAAAPNAQVYCRRFLSVEQRKALRRKRRRLSEAGPLALAIHAAPEETSAALETFCRIEAQGWKGRAGTALAQDPAGRAYVADVLSTMAASDQAFVAVLLAGDAPVAAGLFLRAGGEVFFWKTCYDESLARRSPGVIFDLMLTEWLYDQPWFERLDAGHDDSVDPGSMIWGQRRPMADLLIDLAPGSLRGRTALAGLRLRGLLRGLGRRYARK